MTLIETPIFTELLPEYLSDDGYRELQQALLLRPDAGNVIPGSRGLRKLRCGLRTVENVVDYASFVTGMSVKQFYP